ncbi:hypothetical protein [Paenibacillus humicola]|uniref:hypothetical protein n=1 Tax=Paenibacillus humicola TaxID=3110540 RepID=UPI00237BCB11|nr:hypothetical protein [Paenibacillus humicola]
MELPASVDPALIGAPGTTLTINGNTAAAQPQQVAIGDANGNGIPDAVIKFDRQQVIQAAGNASGAVPVLVQGPLSDGNRFSGTGTIQVIQ